MSIYNYDCPYIKRPCENIVCGEWKKGKKLVDECDE